MKKIIAGVLIGGAALGAGNLQAAEAEVQKSEIDTVFYEGAVITNNGENEFDNYLALGGFAKLFAVDTESFDKLEFAGRGNFDFGVLNGNGELIGYSDSHKNMGSGVNFRAETRHFRFGGALEKLVLGGNSKRYNSIWAAKEFDSLNASAGISETEQDSFGTASIFYSHKDYGFGAGLTINNEGKGFATAVFGKSPVGIGEGTGYRIFGFHDLENNYFADFLISTKSRISKGTLSAPVLLDNGGHDKGIIENWFDAHIPLNARTSPGGFAINARYSDQNDIEKAVIKGLYQLPVFGKISPRIGIGYSSTNDGNDTVQSGSILLGAEIDGKHYIDFRASGTENQKPAFSVTAGVEF